LDTAVNGKRLGLTAGTQIRDFCSVNDIVDAVIRVIECDQGPLIQKFNLGSGLSLTLRRLIENVCDELEMKTNLNFGEIPMHPYEPNHSVANISHAEAQLGWKPKTNLAYAVWELAREVAPSLKLKCPARNCGSL
jgi:nucleoside-diphosphate-sugar epimerase